MVAAQPLTPVSAMWTVAVVVLVTLLASIVPTTNGFVSGPRNSSRLFQSQHQLQNHHHHLTTMSAIPNVAKKAIGKLHPDKTAFLLCDIQDRFRPLLYRGETIIQTARYLTSVAKTLDIPIVVTQQYTKVFGPTVQDCFANESNLKSVPIFDKKLFSMLTEDCRDHLSTLQRTSYVLFGIETHVCVQQTALDLLEDGHDVHIVVDGVTSQQPFDREIALQRLSAAGAFLTTAQSVAFMLMQSADHPNFKAVSKLTVEHMKLPNAFNDALKDPEP